MEVFEKLEKEQRLHESVPREGSREITFDEQQLKSVQANKKELDHLENGQIFLPPQILLNSWTHRCHQIVEVHDKVHQTVESGEEGSLATRNETEDNPYGQRNAGMVENMQEGDLIILFTHDEKQGIKEIDEFRNVEAIAHLNNFQCIFVVGVIHRLADETVTVEPR